ncbi:MAG: hypothetical protein ACLGI2_16490 [Acidimicrobiia bacterium]
MPGDTFTDDDVLDERAAEAILSGRSLAEAGFQPLAAFANDVRAVTGRADPQPNAALASVLSTGFSTEKGDLLVTAGSNVIGPATTQAAGLPKWRNRTQMLPAGILSGMVAKVVAGVVTGLVGVTGLGAAGALPGPAQDAVATVVNTVSPFNLPTTGGEGGGAVSVSLPVPGGDVDVTVGTGTDGNKTTSSASAGTGGATASAGTTTKSNGGGTGTTANASAGLPTPAIPNLPNVPNLGNLPVPVPTCVSDIVDVRTGQPKVPLGQISTQAANCVRSLIATSGAALPAGVSQCVDSILSMVSGVAPGAVPDIAGLDVNKCVPVDVTKCMSSVMGMFRNLPGANLGFGGSAGTTGGSAGATGGFNVPFMGNLDLSGCMPFNLDACLSSLLGMAGNLPNVNTDGIPGLGAGTVLSLGSLNLSACVPFGSLPSIPGLGFLSSFLPR